MVFRRTRRASQVATSVLLAFTSCTAKAPTANADEVFRRVDGLLWSLAQERTRACVVRSGFSFVVRARKPMPVKAFDFPDYLSQLRAVGSGLTQHAIDGATGKTEKTLNTENRDPNAAYRESLGSADLSKFDSSLEECTRTTDRASTSLTRDFVNILGAYSTSLARPETDTQAALKARFEPLWRGCMKKGGYGLEGIDKLYFVIQARISAANGDIAILRNQVLPFDKQISLASWNCDSEWRKHRAQQTVKMRTTPASKLALDKLMALEGRILRLREEQ